MSDFYTPRFIRTVRHENRHVPTTEHHYAIADSEYVLQYRDGDDKPKLCNERGFPVRFIGLNEQAIYKAILADRAK